MSSICQIHTLRATTRPLVSDQPLRRCNDMCASPAGIGPVALDLHRHSRGHRPLPDALARRRPRQGTIHPPEPGADRLPLRSHPTDRPRALRRLAVWTCAGSSATFRTAFGQLGSSAWRISVVLVFRAMMTNRFFSAVIRIQKDRGHHVIDQGVYGVIRHPGYAGMIPSMTFSGLALGSWLGFAIGSATR